MKQHQFFPGKVAAIFVHHCLAFHIIQPINFSILYSFDADNLIRSSFTEFSFNILVFFTAGGQIELVEFVFLIDCDHPVIWNLKIDKRHMIIFRLIVEIDSICHLGNIT